jgi:2-oxoglutarate ferredoxin oxidoreductase subunit delta
MAKIKLNFNIEKCKGCLLCASVCPKKVLKLDDDQVNATGYNPIMCTIMDDCIGCAMCAIMCPDSVIEIERMGE